ncbi:hypothetical protein ACHHYP_10749 [Achlya hypogyna]|uniref:Uncharacterized protein n=1 Tax=Achlya hypogyna TaxID=1202772 RepID=A0A1V9ZHT5_ACHHY|nr:hypothetical protein ACHHYP_10749 [Achlya hypogyna]
MSKRDAARAVTARAGVPIKRFRFGGGGSKIPVPVPAVATAKKTLTTTDRPRVVAKDLTGPKRPTKPTSDEVEATRPRRDEGEMDKHSELMKQSNEYLEMSEKFKLRAEVERLASKVAQVEEREKKHMARKKMLAESVKVLQEQLAEMTQQNKDMREKRAEDAVKIRDLQAQLDRKKEKGAREVKKDILPVPVTAEARPSTTSAQLLEEIQKRQAFIAEGLEASKEAESVLRALLTELS